MHVVVPMAIAFILLGAYEASAQTTQPTPIFNSPAGFALLTLVAGLGLYLPVIEVAVKERYATIAGESWPDDADTLRRLANLEYVQTSLKRIIVYIFLFILVVAIRLVAYAGWVISPGFMPVEVLYWWDFATVVALGLFVARLWWMKYRKSKAESEVEEKLRELRNARHAISPQICDDGLGQV